MDSCVGLSLLNLLKPRNLARNQNFNSKRTFFPFRQTLKCTRALNHHFSVSFSVWKRETSPQHVNGWAAKTPFAILRALLFSEVSSKVVHFTCKPYLRGSQHKICGCRQNMLFMVLGMCWERVKKKKRELCMRRYVERIYNQILWKGFRKHWILPTTN